MKASDLNWDQVNHFDPKEWDLATLNYNRKYGLAVDTVLEHVSASWVLRLARLRAAYGKSVIPSPNEGAWIRHYGSKDSMHFVGTDFSGLSRAGDVFPEGDLNDVYRFYTEACKEFSGVGIYTDTVGPTETGIMFHLDERPIVERLEWARNETGYHYPVNGGRQKDVFESVLETLRG